MNCEQKYIIWTCIFLEEAYELLGQYEMSKYFRQDLNIDYTEVHTQHIGIVEKEILPLPNFIKIFN
jgi:hypothetical protein